MGEFNAIVSNDICFPRNSSTLRVELQVTGRLARKYVQRLRFAASGRHVVGLAEHPRRLKNLSTRRTV